MILVQTKHRSSTTPTQVQHKSITTPSPLQHNSDNTFYSLFITTMQATLGFILCIFIITTAVAWESCTELDFYGHVGTYCVRAALEDTVLLISAQSDSLRFKTLPFRLPVLINKTWQDFYMPVAIGTQLCLNISRLQVRLLTPAFIVGCFKVDACVLGHVVVEKELGCVELDSARNDL